MEVDPVFNSLNATTYEQQNSDLNFLLYLRPDVNNVCQDPADLRLRYKTVAPRLTRRWFVDDFSARSGFTCPYGSPRNAWGWHFSGVKHRLGVAVDRPFAVFNITRTVAADEVGIAVSIEGQTSSSFVLGGSGSRFSAQACVLTNINNTLFNSSIPNRRIVVPDPQSAPTRVSLDNWRLLDASLFSGALNSLTLSHRIFFNAASCGQPHGSGIIPFSTLWNDVSNHPTQNLPIPNALLTGDSALMRGEFLSGWAVARYNVSKIPLQISVFAPVSLLEPYPRIVSIAEDSSISPTVKTFLISLANDGGGSGDVMLSANCTLSWARADPIVTALPALTQTPVALSVQITNDSADGSMMCAFSASIVPKPFFSPINKSSSSTSAFTVYSGCWAVLPEPQISLASFANLQPTWLPLERTSPGARYFQGVLTGSIENSGTAAGTFLFDLQCQTVPGVNFTFPRRTWNETIPAGATRVFDWPLLTQGIGSANVTTACSLVISLARQQCWTRQLKQAQINLTMTAPYDFCLVSGPIEEPFLFIGPTEWQNSTATDLAVINQSEWTRQPESFYLSLLRIRVLNAGSAGCNVTAYAACGGAVVFEPSRSTLICNAAGYGGCSLSYAMFRR
eukprot:TRINITY_DN1248_c0_g1_i2.p1 TRINITY_DN1248_c0_g1~~TRINITY_DN1248_c0_g1_i2.p1  ORF type:complete len:714 (-),score=59.53 TRINITY_DN1248_c0_g1_i2:61-1923(-)